MKRIITLIILVLVCTILFYNFSDTFKSEDQILWEEFNELYMAGEIKSAINSSNKKEITPTIEITKTALLYKGDSICSVDAIVHDSLTPFYTLKTLSDIIDTEDSLSLINHNDSAQFVEVENRILFYKHRDSVFKNLEQCTNSGIESSLQTDSTNSYSIRLTESSQYEVLVKVAVTMMNKGFNKIELLPPINSKQTDTVIIESPNVYSKMWDTELRKRFSGRCFSSATLDLYVIDNSDYTFLSIKGGYIPTYYKAKYWICKDSTDTFEVAVKEDIHTELLKQDSTYIPYLNRYITFSNITDTVTYYIDEHNSNVYYINRYLCTDNDELYISNRGSLIAKSEVLQNGDTLRIRERAIERNFLFLSIQNKKRKIGVLESYKYSIYLKKFDYKKRAIEFPTDSLHYFNQKMYSDSLLISKYKKEMDSLTVLKDSMIDYEIYSDTKKYNYRRVSTDENITSYLVSVARLYDNSPDAHSVTLLFDGNTNYQRVFEFTYKLKSIGISEIYFGSHSISHIYPNYCYNRVIK